MTMIRAFGVEQFRGIKGLRVDNLNRINIIVGDNNCGKTSVLEAIQFLRTSGTIANVYKIARQRENMLFINANSIYDNFICMFPKAEEQLAIRIWGECDEGNISYDLSGIQKEVLVDIKEFERHLTRMSSDIIGEDTKIEEFSGAISLRHKGEEKTEEIKINRYSRISGTTVLEQDDFKIVYVAPFEHLKSNIMNQILRVDGYKEICLAALQLFDPEIEDMLILKSDIGNRPVEYLKHRRIGMMPLSTYGDGIKKVLLLSNAIAKAADGILLIDEIETSIHKKYYDDIFRFIVKACKAFQVQVFITTHSLEAIDGLLATQDYREQVTDDVISVVTLKREENQTYARVLSGREVFENREAFGFEVRL